MPAIPPDPDLHARLAAWVAAGLLDRGQAERIEAAEQGRTSWTSERAPSAHVPSAADRGGRGSLVVEALGYLGAAMTVVAGFLAVHRLWPDIPAGAQATFAAVAAAALGGAATVVSAAAQPSLVRLRSTLWLLSTACLAAFAGVLAGRVGDFSPQITVLAAAGTATAYATLLWLREPLPLQHLAVFASAAVMTGAAIACVGDDVPLWAPGSGVWLLSAAWAVAAHHDRVPPRGTGYLVAAIGLLVSAQMTLELPVGHVLALATVGGLLTAGVVLRRVWLLALGAYGTVQTVPQTAERYLPGSFAAPLSVLMVGVVLLMLALVLAKWSKRTGPRRPPGGARTAG
ncbi:hypothetical protein DI272_01820 [Streptomyces sp. Act143]|uniref:DUF2157 domain-containing protein n=1 Tax=Streptomyces sp. Act143 TaxID=2200760 RepID=UPI000D6841DC|nr:DUF2157 domain-containing protein [Streptomyces sp. Act143]PWI13012.1 hypothetical protein DI272_01820 [Streptomyces sp. Act143]